MEILFVLLIVIFLGWYLISSRENEQQRIFEEKQELQRQEREREQQEIINIANDVQRIFEKINTLKTMPAILNNISKAIDLLGQADYYPECRNIIGDYDDLIDKLFCMQKVYPVIDAVEKSYKHQFKGKDKLELNALQDALYHIRQHNISNDDFDTAVVMPDGTGEIVTIEGLEARCKELGWEKKA